MAEFVIHFDGSCGPKNPGKTGGYGFTIQKDGKFLYQESGKINSEKYISNNYAEFYALYKALDYLKAVVNIADKLFIRGDSQLAIGIMGKKWTAKETSIYWGAYVLAYNALRELRLTKFVATSFDWVPREMNAVADELADYKS